MQKVWNSQHATCTASRSALFVVTRVLHCCCWASLCYMLAQVLELGLSYLALIHGLKMGCFHHATEQVIFSVAHPAQRGVGRSRDALRIQDDRHMW